MKSSFFGKLGRDFWLYRVGQFISMLGDSCGSIALSWWILEKTGSAAKMAAIMGPALLFRVLCLPLFGPLGDRFKRKWVVSTSDFLRFVVSFSIFSLCLLDYFDLSVVILLYIIQSIGTALFLSVSESIIPQLVTPEEVGPALQQGQAITSMATIIGGILGGTLVAFIGVKGAFLVDSSTFLIAGLFSLGIKTDTTPKEKLEAMPGESYSASKWQKELLDGLNVVRKIPIELGVAAVAGILNFAVSPMYISLVYFVKEFKKLPAWYLGTMESLIGIGGIVGAGILTWVCTKFPRDLVIIFGIALSGLAVVLVPWVPTLVLPLVMTFLFGLGVVIANICLQSHSVVAMPDRFRSRVSSVRTCIAVIAAPAGMGLGGYAISLIGLKWTMLVSGSIIVATCPLLLLVPHFSRFYRADTATASKYYEANFPDAFKN